MTNEQPRALLVGPVELDRNLQTGPTVDEGRRRAPESPQFRLEGSYFFLAF